MSALALISTYNVTVAEHDAQRKARGTADDVPRTVTGARRRACAGSALNSGVRALVPRGMWDDRRLQAALAAVPAEAFIEGPPENEALLRRRTLRRLRREQAGRPDPAPPPAGHLASVVELRPGTSG